MDWYRLKNEAEIPSPALILDSGRLARNLARMVEIAGDPARLWPHVKTHKLTELVAIQVQLGIRRFKCATIAEAEMIAGVPGVERILLALQPVGPQIPRLLELGLQHRSVRFAAVVDDPGIVLQLSQATARTRTSAGTPSSLDLFLDLDVGQGRTGISPGDSALELIRQILESPGLRLAGLHAYDGHLGIPDLAERATRCDDAFAPVESLRGASEQLAGRELEVLAGGSPTFALHARRARVSLSPGTTVFWDAGYAQKLPDLPFEPAAFLLCRVISRPGGNRLCLDLGHKALASEMPQPRALFLNLDQPVAMSHSEEHLVVETPSAPLFPVGSVVYALPWHVCPTVALHSEVWHAEDQVATGRWTVRARDRKLTV